MSSPIQMRQRRLLEMYEAAKRTALPKGYKETLLFNWLVNFGQGRFGLTRRTAQDYAGVVMRRLDAQSGRSSSDTSGTSAPESTSESTGPSESTTRSEG